MQAKVYDLRVERMSRDASDFDVSRDTPNPHLFLSKQQVKKKSVLYGRIAQTRMKQGPPADQHDWPGWFKTLAFRDWLATARGIQRTFAQEYRSYRSVVSRCRTGRNELDPDFATFRAFLGWALPAIGRRPTQSHTLDRINVADPVYGPDRVRWADKQLQAENRRTTKRVPAPNGHGSTTIRAAATNTSQLADTIRKRMQRGWTAEEAIAGRRRGTRGCPTVAPALWPLGLDPTAHARAYAAFQAVLPPEFRHAASRLLFLWCLYVRTSRSAAKAISRPKAVAWLSEHSATAEGIEELLAPAEMSYHRTDGQHWMECNSGSHAQVCGCRLARYGIDLAKFEMGWWSTPPKAPDLPKPPPPPLFYDADHDDPGDIDPGDHDAGDE